MTLDAAEILSAIEASPEQTVVLTGSYARGEADHWSDVDVVVLGPKKAPNRSFYSRERLYVVSHETADSLRDSLADPGAVPYLVPGLRQSKILQDPAGEAENLIMLASEWEWSQVEAAVPAWLGQHLVGMVEDLHKVCSAIETGDLERAYDPLQVLVFGCIEAMLVGSKLLVDTQNRTFATLRAHVGGDHPWWLALAEATGLDTRPLLQGLAAGVRLYVETSRQLSPLLPAAYGEVVIEAAHRCSAFAS